jgi:hypothetical protein
MRLARRIIDSVHSHKELIRQMARPVTLFTGQWADLPLEQLAQMASGWGFDGLELATRRASAGAPPSA